MKEGADKATAKKTEPTEEAEPTEEVKAEAAPKAKTKAAPKAKTKAEEEPTTIKDNFEVSEIPNSDMKEMLTALKKEFPDLQRELMTGLENMDSIIGKTESFVEKYENYKANSKSNVSAIN